MPTPPPWWRLTQVAPPAVLSSALSSGQSDDGVGAVLHRLGLAVGAGDRAGVEVVAADDDRAPSARPSCTISLKAQAGLVRARRGRASRCAPAGPGTRCARAPCRASGAGACSSGNSSLILRVGLVDVLRVAGERDPAERALALAEQRPDVGRHEAGEVEGVLARPRRRRPGGCCCRSRRSGTPIAWKSSIACTCTAQRLRRAPRVSRACCDASRCAALPLRDASSRRAGSR